jgi:hypothetical protein
MGRSRTTKFILLAGSATLLQGCVAAVVPFAAGGLMGGSSLDRGSDNAVAQAQPAPDPSVTVERSPAQAAPRVAEEAATLAVAEAPTEAAGTADQTVAFAEASEVPPMSAVEPDPAPEVIAAPAAATEEPALAAIEVQPESVSAAEAVVIAEPVAVAEATPERALAAAPVLEETPTPPAAAPAEQPASTAPLRVIAVNRQAAFADSAADAPSVSAAQAAAALSSVAAADEPVEATASLARTPRAPEPAPAPSATIAMNTEAAAPVTVPPPPPPPAPAPEPARTAPRPLATGEFAALINYANRQQSRSAQNRASAVLADRASLQPDRAACNGNEATVLIDLDPEGDTFDPTLVERAAPGLPSALAQLRAAGVKIAWISANPANQVGSIREALNRSGLDIENADQLLLMRYPEDRKQTRREDLAENACLVAIAGDTRTDFDELFEYLLNPQAAATLDPLMGNGWFIIPSPLATER